jgi:hypothetical protein
VAATAAEKIALAVIEKLNLTALNATKARVR